MSEVIYRKYRPQKFSDLVNQEHVRKTLENEIRTDRIAHAYLFSGPRGIGKTTVARLLAKAVNCLNRKEKESEPCNKCHHCQEIMEGRFLDLIEIDAASHTGVDNVRGTIIENVRFVPHSAKFKVFIIDEAHMLSNSAFNALLKTLEEPPSYAIFILATTEPHKIPETIISRCQRFDFKKVGVKELTERLSHLAKQEGLKIDKDVLVTIAARSEGCIRDAESLLQQILSLGEKRITMDEASLVLPRSDIKLVINFCEHLFKNEISGALQLVNNLLEEGVDLEQFVGDTIEFLRKLLVYSVDPELATLKAELDEDIEEKLKNLNTQTKTPRIAFLISLFIDKKREIKQAEIPPLPLELLVVEFCENQENKKSIQPKTDHPLGENQKNNQTHSAGSGQAIEQSARNARASEAGGSNNISLDNDINKDKDVSNVNERAGDISFDSIKNNWDKILLEIKKQNHSISAFLKTGQLIAFSNQILQIRFSYKFHQDRIKDVKNKRIVEQCISQVVGQPVKLEFKTLEVNNNAGKTNRVIEDALEVFGGELVEE